MAFKDLRGFLEKLKEEKELLEINGADCDLELGAITEVVAKRNCQALLFDKIKGYPQGYRVAANLLNARKRCAIALGMPTDTPNLEIIKKFRHLAGSELIKPVEVKTGPVMENVYFGKEVNLLKFPTPKWHELDGGRYMGTWHLVIMKDTDEGWVNAGVQRVMLQDENTLSLYITPGRDNYVIRGKYYSRGKNCPVVMSFGPDPVSFIAGTVALPWGISELDWAGMVRQEPVEVIKGEITGIPYPANSEIVIEGECLLPSVEMRPEGPFGEWTGYYAREQAPTPVVRVKALYHRDNPILPGAPPMKPPLIGMNPPVLSASAVWDSLEASGVRGVQGVWFLEGGGEHSVVVVSIKQDHAGHARQAGLVAASGYFKRIVIVVDDDIDPTDPQDVLWAIAMRCNPATQIDVIKHCWSGPLDPTLTPDQREKGDYTHNTLIIDACKPFYWKDRFPATNKISLELEKKVIEKWRDRIKL